MGHSQDESGETRRPSTQGYRRGGDGGEVLGPSMVDTLPLLRRTPHPRPTSPLDETSDFPVNAQVIFVGVCTPGGDGGRQSE